MSAVQHIYCSYRNERFLNLIKIASSFEEYSVTSERKKCEVQTDIKCMRVLRLLYIEMLKGEDYIRDEPPPSQATQLGATK